MSFTLRGGTSPLLVSMPHIGTEIPRELQAAYVPRALAVEDTDWHLDRLYDFLPELCASVLTPRYSRYVIDLNRPPDDAPMYPGAANTKLCPTHFFSGDALYQAGCEPAPDERARRRDAYWQPYHTALAEVQVCTSVRGVTHVVNGRFKGGYITRHYGAPQDRIHAVQLEMCQCLYMEEVLPFDYDTKRASAIQPLLKAMLASAMAGCRECNEN